MGVVTSNRTKTKTFKASRCIQNPVEEKGFRLQGSGGKSQTCCLAAGLSQASSHPHLSEPEPKWPLAGPCRATLKIPVSQMRPCTDPFPGSGLASGLSSAPLCSQLVPPLPTKLPSHCFLIPTPSFFESGSFPDFFCCRCLGSNPGIKPHALPPHFPSPGPQNVLSVCT